MGTKEKKATTVINCNSKSGSIFSGWSSSTRSCIAFLRSCSEVIAVSRTGMGRRMGRKDDTWKATPAIRSPRSLSRLLNEHCDTRMDISNLSSRSPCSTGLEMQGRQYWKDSVLIDDLKFKFNACHIHVSCVFGRMQIRVISYSSLFNFSTIFDFFLSISRVF